MQCLLFASDILDVGLHRIQYDYHDMNNSLRMVMGQHLAFSENKYMNSKLLKLNLFIFALHTNDLFKV